MSKMKLSDYVADFLSRIGIRHAFIISGGASIHLLHSVASHPKIAHICPHHEQGAAMAADAYARATGGLGCAIATSGPGATNMITGIAGAWFDSVPVLYITGQVTTFRMKGETGVRQMGFQETEIISMVQPITKYAIQIRQASRIRYELEKAVHIATTGRPGPVLLDIPDDLQRDFIDPAKLEGFVPETKAEQQRVMPADTDIAKAIQMIGDAKRPVLVLGWGIRLSKAVDDALLLAERLGFPILTSWAARDMVSNNYENLAGTFGTHGTRTGNFAVQNADLVLAIGNRMSTRETGSPMESWAREAKTIIVDIDQAELNKFPHFGKKIDLPICADAGAFIRAMLHRNDTIVKQDIGEWQQRIKGWKKNYPLCTAEALKEKTVNPYVFASRFSQHLADKEHVFIDTGCAIAWLMQAGHYTKGQRLYHDFNNTAMGWGLPAAMGGALALGKPVTCVSGDGSLMMNVQELATIKKHKLPVRLFVLNNKGYSMVRQTEQQWLGGKHAGTSDADLEFPDFVKLAQSFDIPAVRIETNDEIDAKITEAFKHKGTVLIDVIIPPHHGVMQQSKFGYPIEDSEPLLPREEFLANMIVKPMPKSLEPID